MELSFIESPIDLENLASSKLPSLWALFPAFPANLDTYPSEISILIIVFAPWSATHKSPFESKVKGPGFLNLAFNKLPSFWPQFPLPAKSETSADGVIFLILWLLWSETYKLSLESIAIPDGDLKEASDPFPFAYS